MTSPAGNAGLVVEPDGDVMQQCATSGLPDESPKYDFSNPEIAEIVRLENLVIDLETAVESSRKDLLGYTDQLMMAQRSLARAKRSVRHDG